MALLFTQSDTARKELRMNITWHIKPLNTPAALRSCSHCGGQSAFVCSNKFRVNAQQKNLDVWLIYNCKKCGCSWNMTIYSRVRPADIGKELYDELLENSADLALKYAFDADLLRRNNVRACYDDVAYDVVGDDFLVEHLRKEDVILHIRSPYNLQLYLDKLIREKTGISRSRLEECFKQSAITCEDYGFHPEKSRIILKGDMTLRFHQSAVGIFEP